MAAMNGRHPFDPALIGPALILGPGFEQRYLGEVGLPVMIQEVPRRRLGVSPDGGPIETRTRA